MKSDDVIDWDIYALRMSSVEVLREGLEAAGLVGPLMQVATELVQWKRPGQGVNTVGRRCNEIGLTYGFDEMVLRDVYGKFINYVYTRGQGTLAEWFKESQAQMLGEKSLRDQRHAEAERKHQEEQQAKPAKLAQYNLEMTQAWEAGLLIPTSEVASKLNITVRHVHSLGLAPCWSRSVGSKEKYEVYYWSPIQVQALRRRLTHVGTKNAAAECGIKPEKFRRLAQSLGIEPEWIERFSSGRGSERKDVTRYCWSPSQVALVRKSARPGIMKAEPRVSRFDRVEGLVH